MKITFNENLKNIRQNEKLSQKDLAEKLHISIKTISHWETGYTEPSLVQLIMLSKILDVSIDDLLGVE